MEEKEEKEMDANQKLVPILAEIAFKKKSRGWLTEIVVLSKRKRNEEDIKRAIKV